ncbi:MAG: hypothetical protein RIC03_06890 [Cyclobacteriaceae bacterium]
MKKLLTLVLLTILFTACEQEEITEKITVDVSYEFTDSFGRKTWPASHPIPVFLFENITHLDYEYIGNGIIKNKQTGKEVSYTRMQELNQSFTIFEELPLSKHTVVIDMWKSKIDDHRMTTASLDKIGSVGDYDFTTIDMEIDISPYQPWNLYE